MDKEQIEKIWKKHQGNIYRTPETDAFIQELLKEHIQSLTEITDEELVSYLEFYKSTADCRACKYKKTCYRTDPNNILPYGGICKSDAEAQLSKVQSIYRAKVEKLRKNNPYDKNMSDPHYMQNIAYDRFGQDILKLLGGK
jgi:hypothetical protein